MQKLRLALNLTQSDLGRATDMTQSQISGIETTEKHVWDFMVVAIAKALRVSTDYLLDVTDDPAPSSGSKSVRPR